MQRGDDGVAKVATTRNLVVKNIPYSFTNADLQAIAAAFGPTESVLVVKDLRTGMSLGYGFVCFKTEEDAAAALTGMDGMTTPAHSYTEGGERMRFKVERSKHTGVAKSEKCVHVKNVPVAGALKFIEAIRGFGDVTDVQFIPYTPMRYLDDIDYVMCNVTFRDVDDAVRVVQAIDGKVMDVGQRPLFAKFRSSGRKSALSRINVSPPQVQQQQHVYTIVTPVPVVRIEVMTVAPQ